MIVATWTYVGREYRLVSPQYVVEVKDHDAAGGVRWMTHPSNDYLVLMSGIRELAARLNVASGGLPQNYREG